MLSMLTMRRQMQAKESERNALSGTSDYENERVGRTRRKRKRQNCHHDPWARELAQVIMGAYYWISKSTSIKPSLGNGLEDTMWSRFCSKEQSIFMGMLGYRLMSCLVVQTYYVPDEYWQSLEVAHNHAYGHGYLTWEWTAKIRGYLYPSIFTMLYKALDLLGMDSFFTIVKLPRLLQASFYALSDLYLFKLSCKLAGPLVGEWTLLVNSLCWFTFYCSSRTLTNTMETALIVIALYYYPWTKQAARSGGTWRYLWIAAISVMVRPTAVIVWIPLCLNHIFAMRKQVWSTFVLYFLTGLAFGFISMRIDKAFYGQWSLVPLNFFQFNINRQISHIYGTHPWHWYVTQGIPFILSTHCIPLVAGWKKCKNRSLQTILIWTVFSYSLLAHKEFRFVLPMVPMAMHVCGYYITVLHQQSSQRSNDSDPVNEEAVRSHLKKLNSKKTDNDSGLTVSELSDSVSESDIVANVRRRLSKPRLHRPWFSPKTMLLLLVAGNLPMMLYFSVLHQRGSLDVVKFLHAESLEKPKMSIIFLMPCHSTPYYSHIHTNITMRFLTCDPNLNATENYRTEAQRFFEDPIQWLRSEVVKGPNKHVYSHVTMFDSLEPKIEKFLSKGSYKLCSKHFYSHFPEEEEKSKYIVVYCR
ncbi:GPI mannosyltransferase 3-like [Watersipora subatra]|uniref:GPI mannosyltransferase 3-like n=1 Tax=Watersipora subatra TaxID=2589382 RepID=UPI00355BD18E